MAVAEREKKRLLDALYAIGGDEFLPADVDKVTDRGWEIAAEVVAASAPPQPAPPPPSDGGSWLERLVSAGSTALNTAAAPFRAWDRYADSPMAIANPAAQAYRHVWSPVYDAAIEPTLARAEDVGEFIGSPVLQHGVDVAAGRRTPYDLSEVARRYFAGGRDFARNLGGADGGIDFAGAIDRATDAMGLDPFVAGTAGVVFDPTNVVPGRAVVAGPQAAARISAAARAAGAGSAARAAGAELRRAATRWGPELVEDVADTGRLARGIGRGIGAAGRLGVEGLATLPLGVGGVGGPAGRRGARMSTSATEEERRLLAAAERDRMEAERARGQADMADYLEGADAGDAGYGRNRPLFQAPTSPQEGRRGEVQRLSAEDARLLLAEAAADPAAARELDASWGLDNLREVAAPPPPAANRRERGHAQAADLVGYETIDLPPPQRPPTEDPLQTLGWLSRGVVSGEIKPGARLEIPNVREVVALYKPADWPDGSVGIEAILKEQLGLTPEVQAVLSDFLAKTKRGGEFEARRTMDGKGWIVKGKGARAKTKGEAVDNALRRLKDQEFEKAREAPPPPPPAASPPAAAAAGESGVSAAAQAEFAAIRDDARYTIQQGIDGEEPATTAKALTDQGNAALSMLMSNPNLLQDVRDLYAEMYAAVTRMLDEDAGALGGRGERNLTRAENHLEGLIAQTDGMAKRIEDAGKPAPEVDMTVGRPGQEAAPEKRGLGIDAVIGGRKSVREAEAERIERNRAEAESRERLRRQGQQGFTGDMEAGEINTRPEFGGAAPPSAAAPPVEAAPPTALIEEPEVAAAIPEDRWENVNLSPGEIRLSPEMQARDTEGADQVNEANLKTLGAWDWDKYYAGDKIRVWRDPESGEHVLVSGHHRLKMAKDASVRELPVRVMPEGSTWQEAIEESRLRNADTNAQSLKERAFQAAERAGWFQREGMPYNQLLGEIRAAYPNFGNARDVRKLLNIYATGPVGMEKADAYPGLADALAMIGEHVRVEPRGGVGFTRDGVLSEEDALTLWNSMTNSGQAHPQLKNLQDRISGAIKVAEKIRDNALVPPNMFGEKTFGELVVVAFNAQDQALKDAKEEFIRWARRMKSHEMAEKAGNFVAEKTLKDDAASLENARAELKAAEEYAERLAIARFTGETIEIPKPTSALRAQYRERFAPYPMPVNPEQLFAADGTFDKAAAKDLLWEVREKAKAAAPGNSWDKTQAGNKAVKEWEATAREYADALRAERAKREAERAAATGPDAEMEARGYRRKAEAEYKYLATGEGKFDPKTMPIDVLAYAIERMGYRRPIRVPSDFTPDDKARFRAQTKRMKAWQKALDERIAAGEPKPAPPAGWEPIRPEPESPVGQAERYGVDVAKSGQPDGSSVTEDLTDGALANTAEERLAAGVSAMLRDAGYRMGSAEIDLSDAGLQGTLARDAAGRLGLGTDLLFDSLGGAALEPEIADLFGRILAGFVERGNTAESFTEAMDEAQAAFAALGELRIAGREARAAEQAALRERALEVLADRQRITKEELAKRLGLPAAGSRALDAALTKMEFEGVVVAEGNVFGLRGAAAPPAARGADAQAAPDEADLRARVDALEGWDVSNSKPPLIGVVAAALGVKRNDAVFQKVFHERRAAFYKGRADTAAAEGARKAAAREAAAAAREAKEAAYRAGVADRAALREARRKGHAISDEQWRAAAPERKAQWAKEEPEPTYGTEADLRAELDKPQAGFFDNRKAVDIGDGLQFWTLPPLTSAIQWLWRAGRDRGWMSDLVNGEGWIARIAPVVQQNEFGARIAQGTGSLTRSLARLIGGAVADQSVHPLAKAAFANGWTRETQTRAMQQTAASYLDDLKDADGNRFTDAKGKEIGGSIESLFGPMVKSGDEKRFGALEDWRRSDGKEDPVFLIDLLENPQGFRRLDGSPNGSMIKDGTAQAEYLRRYVKLMEGIGTWLQESGVPIEKRRGAADGAGEFEPKNYIRRIIAAKVQNGELQETAFVARHQSEYKRMRDEENLDIRKRGRAEQHAVFPSAAKAREAGYTLIPAHAAMDIFIADAVRRVANLELSEFLEANARLFWPAGEKQGFVNLNRVSTATREMQEDGTWALKEGSVGLYGEEGAKIARLLEESTTGPRLGRFDSALRVTSDIANVSRTLVLNFDASVLFVQLAIQSARRPVKFGLPALRDFFTQLSMSVRSDEEYARFRAGIIRAARTKDKALGTSLLDRHPNSTLSYRVRNEFTRGVDIVGDLPYVGKPFRAFGNHFDGLRDWAIIKMAEISDLKAHIDMNARREKNNKSPLEVPEEPVAAREDDPDGWAAYDAAAEEYRQEMHSAAAQADRDEFDAVSVGALGELNSIRLGIGGFQRQMEHLALFLAPRFLRATFGLMGSFLQGGVRGAEAKKLLAMYFGVMAGVLLATHIGFGLADLGQKRKTVEQRRREFWNSLDPRKASFGTVETPFGFRVGPSHQMIAILRALGNISNSMVGTRGARPVYESAYVVPLEFWRARASPLSGAVLDAVSGEDFLGESVNPLAGFTQGFSGWNQAGRFAKNRLLPILAQSAIDEFNTLNSAGAYLGLTGASALSLRTSPDNRTDKLELATHQLLPGMQWEELEPGLEDYIRAKTASDLAEMNESNIQRGNRQAWVGRFIDDASRERGEALAELAADALLVDDDNLYLRWRKIEDRATGSKNALFDQLADLRERNRLPESGPQSEEDWEALSPREYALELWYRIIRIEDDAYRDEMLDWWVSEYEGTDEGDYVLRNTNQSMRMPGWLNWRLGNTAQMKAVAASAEAMERHILQETGDPEAAERYREWFWMEEEFSDAYHRKADELGMAA